MKLAQYKIAWVEFAFTRVMLYTVGALIMRFSNSAAKINLKSK